MNGQSNDNISGKPTMSYAQNFEDVMIARLFERDYRGFYIDVGAADPVFLSVTKHFYDSGWRGINIEPLPRFYERLRSERPEDINLNVAVGTTAGRASFFEIVESAENSTMDEEIMRALAGGGNTVKTHVVELLPLAEICRRYCEERRIDVLKVDVEGAELDVLRSADWDRFRPLLVVVEAVKVNGREEVWHQWEHVLAGARYEKVWFDGLNNFYLREESLDLKVHFRIPPNTLDRFTVPEVSALLQSCAQLTARIEDIDADRRAKDTLIIRISEELQGVEADRRAKDEILHRVSRELQDVEADRRAKDKVLEKLTYELDAVESDRRAKDELIERLTRNINDVEADRRAKDALLQRVSRELQDVEADRRAKDKALEKLSHELEAIESDRRAKDELIERLARNLEEVEVDRRAKDEVLQRVSRELQDVEADRCAKDKELERLTHELDAIESDRRAKDISSNA
jgi:FkbM family methyltransferase